MRRRTFYTLGAAAAVGSALGTIGYTFKVGPHHLKVKHRPMSIRNLPSTWQGRRIAHISDLHVGDQVDSDYLISALTKIGDLAPDLVCITGDFMSCTGPEKIDEVIRVCSHLPQPPLGIYACLGNHDYGHRWANNAVAEELTSRLQEIGIFVLRNQSIDLDGLHLVGFDDLWANRFSISHLSEIPADAPSLGLSHNPDTADLPGWDQFHGWILSGHTHGGQCKPPFLPPPLLPVKNLRYSKGIYQLEPNETRTLHINPGLGHLTKVRFNCRPEISIFNT